MDSDSHAAIIDLLEGLTAACLTIDWNSAGITSFIHSYFYRTTMIGGGKVLARFNEYPKDSSFQ